MFSKILIGLIVIVIVGVLAVFGLFYKSDLTREDLADTYITAESKFIDLPNGANMHYRDEGNPNGPVLVMVHGGFGSLQNWDGWVAELKNDFRLISMDLLGHGLTGAYPANIYTRHAERDAVHMLLQELGVKRYTIAGNSFGGGIALEVALEYPSGVEGLVLVASEGVPNGEDGYDASMFSNEEPVSPDSPDYATTSWMESLGSKFIGPSVIRYSLDSLIYNKDLITDDFVDYFGRVLRYQGNRESQLLMFSQGFSFIATQPKQDLLPRLSEIKCPTLVMAGKGDTLVPLRVSEAFDEHIAISDLVVVEQAGHMPMIEKPKETAADVRRFFNKYQIGNH